MDIVKIIFFLFIIIIGFILDFFYVKKYGIKETELHIFKYKIKSKHSFILSFILYISALGNLLTPFYGFLLKYNMWVLIIGGILSLFIFKVIIDILRNMTILLVRKSKINISSNKKQ